MHLSLIHVYSTSVCMFIFLWGCVFVSCEHLTAFGRTLAEPASQHDHWSSVTWQIRPWIKKKVVNGPRRRHRKSSTTQTRWVRGIHRMLWAWRIKLKHRGKLTLRKKRRSWKAFYEYVYVLLNSVWACVILGSGVGAAEVQQQGRMLEFCLAWDGERPSTRPGRQSFWGGIAYRGHLGCGARRTVGQEKSCVLDEPLCQRSLLVREGGAKILNVIFFRLLES